MKYVSLFSGIEAATVAWEPLGWEPMCFAEFDEFPSAVLAERYPEVPNVGDVTKMNWKKYRNKVDLVVGGSPCQSFSIAGKREGLQGESGLMFEYIRAVREIRPRWFLWENVPGALSSENGEAFRQLLSEMDKLGYGLAWRVLDAQFFGVAQRRRRLFLVGHLGAEPPAEVLFEPDCLSGNPQSSREKRKELAARAGRRASCAGFKYSAGSSAQSVGYEDELSNTVTTDWHAPAVFGFAQNSRDGAVLRIADDNAKAAIDRDMCGSLKVGGAPPMVAKTLLVRCGKEGGGKSALVSEDVSLTLATTNAQALFPGGASVRRLTPRECERLQGFPTQVRLKAEEMTSDELIACALANGDITCDLANGKVYGTRGPGGKPLAEKRELGFIHPSGYVHINLSSNGVKKQVRAHRVIYMAANGHIPDDMVVDHINNDKSDNRICNLQLLTAKENSKKAADDGLYLSGEDNPRSKITAEIRSRIAHDYCALGMTYRWLAQKYGVSKSRIGQIINECDWTKIPYRGKPADECSDGPRYKAIGNSMAVPVMRWIGERIALAEAGDIS